MEPTVYAAVDHKDVYEQRTDRNIGWITRAEQEILRTRVIGIAGTGGMGGLITAVLQRTGVGELRICDCEKFDLSNINRQLGARLETVGQNKALVTGEELRRICDDTQVVVDPRGISPTSVESFVSGCHLIFDEIEFFAVSARILLHLWARKLGVSIINCNTVGFGTRLFLFTPKSATMEDVLGLSYDDAVELETAARAGSHDARQTIICTVMRGLVPELPDYAPGGKKTIFDRLADGKAPIIGTNPPMATGFAADRALLYLLQQHSPIKRPGIVPTPIMPAYLYFDAGRMEAKIIQERWY